MRWLQILFFSLLSLSKAAMAASLDVSANWLLGEWVLCEDPDNNAKDSMRFDADGSVVSSTAKRTAFTYEILGSRIEIKAHVGLYAIPIEMNASPDFSKQRAGKDLHHASTYVRLDNPRINSCSIH